MSKRHAVALRDFTHADDSFAKDQTILNMDAGHFADWSADGVDLVREATESEVSKARGEKATHVKSETAVKLRRKPKARNSAVPATSAPATSAPTSAEPISPSDE